VVLDTKTLVDSVRDHLDPRLRGVLADPDDLPTAALALLVAPAVVFSDDHDLVDNGFAGQRGGRRPPATCSSSPRRTGSWSACSPA
jgi:hypothetical protein